MLSSSPVEGLWHDTAVGLNVGEREMPWDWSANIREWARAVAEMYGLDR